MIISLSVTIVIIMTLYTGDFTAIIFRVFPGTRITFESILIKIGGLLLGPTLGMLLGASTDILTIIFTAGVFHYGYFFAAIFFGLIGGLLKIIANFTRKHRKDTFFLGIPLIFLATLFSMFFYMGTNLSSPDSDGTLNWNHIGQNLGYHGIIPVFNIELNMKDIIIIILCSGLFALILFIGSFILSMKCKKNYLVRQFETLPIIILLTFLSELLVSGLSLPIFDYKLVNSISYFSWISIRVILLLPMFIFNTLVIWPTYNSIIKIFKYNYLDDYQIDDIDKINRKKQEFFSKRFTPKIKNHFSIKKNDISLIINLGFRFIMNF
ncbi:MAG: hypothetical protein ACRCW6_02415 [Mycoplasmoidaceae bacterium]